MSKLLPYPAGEHRVLIDAAWNPLLYAEIYAVIKIDEEGGWQDWFHVSSPQNKVADDRDFWTQNLAEAWRRYSAIVKRDGQ